MTMTITQKTMRCLALTLAGLAWAGAVLAANPSAPADITVTDEVLATGVEPIGFNMTGVMGGTNFAVNNHVKNSGFEPFVLRKFIRINRAGNNWFEWDQEGGPGFWNLAWTGLLNGAEVRFYRIVDAQGQPLDYSGGTIMKNINGADHVVFLGQSSIPLPGGAFPDGGFIANDDRDGDTDNNMERVYLSDDDLGLRFGDYAYIKLKGTEMGPETSPPDLRQHFSGVKALFHADKEWEPALVPHPQPLPPAFADHGETCLRVTFPEPGRIRLGEHTYHPYNDKEGEWYGRLTPGASYRVSVWLRQEGLGNGGKARVYFNRSYDVASQTEHWEVTDQWQQYTYDFIGPPHPTSGKHISHHLEFTGPGTVWIDNFVLYRNDAKHEYRPFTPHEVSFDETLATSSPAGIKPVVRFYGASYHYSTIEAMFTDYGNPGYGVSWRAGIGKPPKITIAQALYWAYKTGDSPETRVVPMLTLIEEYTEDEWKALAEFLGVPYDPGVDTPQTKPYAYLRYKYRGDDPTPWTDEFREILVEYGNETWHNGGGGHGWHGWGQPEAVHRGGVEYGLFARYMFKEQVMGMPAWQQYGLGDKIKFTLGGNYIADLSKNTAYVEQAVQQGGSISYAGHANYVGPKWETKDEPNTVFDDHGIQMTLLGMHKRMKSVVETAAASRDQLNDSGATNYKIIAYEGGPSGYMFKDNDPNVQAMGELYGKSVAMGVAALDAWLFSSQHGYVHQAYSGFSTGKWWSSHTAPEGGGFRAHPGWLAMKMRNRYALGSTMVAATHNSEPTLESDGEAIPLIASYVLKDEQSYSVFILNRKLDGVHDGHDFGDGYTPVTLHLPFDQVTAITRYRLEQPGGGPVDPRLNNRSDLQVVIGSKEIDPATFSPDFVINEQTGGEAGGVPPGSANLFVFQLGTDTQARKNAVAALRVLAGMAEDLDDTTLTDINNDARIGLEEAVQTLQAP